MNFAYEDQFLTYCCKDTLSTKLTSSALETQLRSNKLVTFYNKIVNPLSHILVKMNTGGVLFDKVNQKEAIEILLAEVACEHKQLESMLGRNLAENFVRTEALSTFLFKEIGLTPTKLTKKRIGSTGVDALGDLMREYPDIEPLLANILSLRKKTKLVNDFIIGAHVRYDGRVYANFKIGPVTGRLACQNPNMQQIPAGVCHFLYRADPGYVFLYFDYSQIELILLAILAGDKIWLDAFASGESVHHINARDLYGFDKSHKVTSAEKTVAKAFIYRLNYGGRMQGAFGSFAALIPDLTPEKLDDMERMYFMKHPALTKFREGIEKELKTKKMLTGVFGRPRRFFAPYDKALRSAYNYKLQNGVGDMMAKRMIEIDKALPAPTFQPWTSAIRMQIHDACIMMVKEEDAEKYAKVVSDIITAPVPELNNFKFKAKVKIGPRWSSFDD